MTAEEFESTQKAMFLKLKSLGIKWIMFVCNGSTKRSPDRDDITVPLSNKGEKEVQALVSVLPRHLFERASEHSILLFTSPTVCCVGTALIIRHGLGLKVAVCNCQMLYHQMAMRRYAERCPDDMPKNMPRAMHDALEQGFSISTYTKRAEELKIFRSEVAQMLQVFACETLGELIKEIEKEIKKDLERENVSRAVHGCIVVMNQTLTILVMALLNILSAANLDHAVARLHVMPAEAICVYLTAGAIGLYSPASA